MTARLGALLVVVTSFGCGASGPAKPSPDAAPGDGASDDGPIAAAPPCTSGDWCWANPVPQGNTLHSVHGSSATDVWAVGEGGAIVRWDGVAWSVVASATDRSLTGVWAFSPSDAWAVGDRGALLRWDGAVWSPVPGVCEICGLAGVWGSAPDDVWAVGTDEKGAGLAVHFDGTTWTAAADAPLHALRAVWGSGPDDVWAVDDSAIVHFDGRAWSVIKELPSSFLSAVWGRAADDVWVAGNGPPGMLVFHWDGHTWTSTSVLESAGGQKFGFTQAPRAIAGTRAGDVWIVSSSDGTGGAIWRWDLETRSWVVVDGGTHVAGLFGAWASGPDDAWAVGGGGQLRRWDGGEWPTRSGGLSFLSHASLGAVWASGPNDAWAAGGSVDVQTVLAHWNGSAWTRGDLDEGGTIAGLGGSGPRDVWAVGGSSRISHWDGTRWTPSPVPERRPDVIPRAVWANAPDDAWIVGDTFPDAGGFALHWDGHAWSDVPIATKGLLAVWGSGRDDVWAVGSGSAMRWDGRAWSTVWSSGSCADATIPLAIWGSGPDDVWAVGVGVERWNGKSWSPFSTGVTSTFVGVWGSGADDVWLLASDGTTARWDGRTLTVSSLPVRLNAIGGSGRDDVWGVGDVGAILHHVALGADGGATGQDARAADGASLDGGGCPADGPPP